MQDDNQPIRHASQMRWLDKTQVRSHRPRWATGILWGLAATMAVCLAALVIST